MGCVQHRPAKNWIGFFKTRDCERHCSAPGGLRDGDQAGFAEGQAGVSILADGWSKPESWGVWGIGDHSALSLRLSSDLFQSTDVNLHVTVRSFLPPGIDSKGIKVFLGEPTGADPLAQWKLTETSKTRSSASRRTRSRGIVWSSSLFRPTIPIRRLRLQSRLISVSSTLPCKAYQSIPNRVPALGISFTARASPAEKIHQSGRH